MYRLAKYIIFFAYNLLWLHSIPASQSYIDSNNLSLPKNALFSDFSAFSYGVDSINASGFNISFHTHLMANSGHANVDNYAELYSPATSARMISARLSYTNPWVFIELEPYNLLHSKAFAIESVGGTYQVNNNHGNEITSRKADMGFRQSRVVLHYNGIGVGYGRMSHWWSPGFHSALALSSNAPSQETYALGTFKDLRLGRFSLGAQIIAMPYTSTTDVQLYFSGLKAHVTYHSNPAITLGLHRTYLSGDFENLLGSTKTVDRWTLEDAARLVIEPLFGQSKRDLSYTIPGTPGFDAWDEVLTGYVKLTFPDEDLEVYADVASDDNRGNITDLKAHWDHTLGYMLGFKKFIRLKRWNFFTGIEYLTTRISNTLKSDFYRGDELAPNYYSKVIYDYFTYEGRRMGAHSGSSSDDLIFLFGASNSKSMIFLSYNKERHGIKSTAYPELKTEIVMTYYKTILKRHTVFITMEYEQISNFAFIQENISESKLLWLGYSFSLY